MMQTNMPNPCLPCELHLPSVIFHQALDVLQHSYILSLRLLEDEEEYQCGQQRALRFHQYAVWILTSAYNEGTVRICDIIP